MGLSFAFTTEEVEVIACFYVRCPYFPRYSELFIPENAGTYLYRYLAALAPPVSGVPFRVCTESHLRHICLSLRRRAKPKVLGVPDFPDRHSRKTSRGAFHHRVRSRKLLGCWIEPLLLVPIFKGQTQKKLNALDVEP